MDYKLSLNVRCPLDLLEVCPSYAQTPIVEISALNNIRLLIKDETNRMGLGSFKALGGKSLGRIDIKMDHLGVPHFIEANLMPGLRKGYFYRSCVLNLDMSYEDMIFSIANTGLSSH